MSWLIPVILVLAVVAALAILKAKRKETTGADDYPYTQAGPLFTPAERSFLGVLQLAVGEDAQVFGKVRVADVVKPTNGLSRSDWQKAFNRISAKHFDFIVCRRDDLSVVCAVELNDGSHQSKNRRQRDSLLEGVCSAARVPLIQVAAKSGYVIADIRELLAPHMGNKVASSTETTPSTSEAEPPARACPKCASPLVKRTATKGKHVGDEFIACSAFPKCRYLEPMDT
jgi:ssDNA-binding Zn-finger/Zn-ribbon topoisomerase 1